MLQDGDAMLHQQRRVLAGGRRQLDVKQRRLQLRLVHQPVGDRDGCWETQSYYGQLRDRSELVTTIHRSDSFTGQQNHRRVKEPSCL